MLCAWNAFALQTLGDKFLEADYSLNPVTAGFVPPVTAEQVLAFYSQVEGWLNRAQQAHSNPGYRLDVGVPADLPVWSEIEPCPNAHLEGMRAAMRALRAHAETALGFFEAMGAPPNKQATIHQARQLWAAATTTARYAEDLWGGTPAAELHEQIEDHLKEAIERLYRLGQMLAVPALLEEDPRHRAAAPTAPPPVQPGRWPPLPGQRGFDPWCLTDPATRQQWKQDPLARTAVSELWGRDPDPTRTLQIQAELDAALARGDIAYATDRFGKRLGHFFCCPWSPVFIASRPVTIGGTRLRTLQEFTFDVSAEEMPRGGEFKREILTGAFQPTRQIDYCNPNERHGGH